MGATGSKGDGNDGSGDDVPTTEAFVHNGTSWELKYQAPKIDFYDAAEDDDMNPRYVLELGEMEIPVSDDTHMVFKSDSFSVSWAFDNEGSYEAWGMRFGTQTEFERFQKKYSDFLFAGKFGYMPTDENRDRMEKDFGADYVDFAMGIGKVDEEIENEPIQDPEAEHEYMDVDYEEADSQGISQVVMGAYNRSYVLDHDEGRISVYGNSVEGLKSTRLSVDLKAAMDKYESFQSPQKSLLMGSESKMAFLATPRTDASCIYQMDIEKEQIIGTWNCRKDGVDIPMMDLTNEHRAAQLEDSSIVLGLDSNRLARWDMRTADGAVQDVEGRRTTRSATRAASLDDDSSVRAASYLAGKDYSRGTNFTCVATTGDGCMAVGSKDGKIRLYNNKSMNQAKTSLPGLGHPVTHVDVTYDGRYVVGTTDHFLVVISTMFRNKHGKIQSGFHERMGTNIAAPRILKIRPQDLIKTGNAKLSGGKFQWRTSDRGRREAFISASLGNATVLWDVEKLRKMQGSEAGQQALLDYQLIIPPSQTKKVVETAFMHQDYNDNLVVATPGKVYSYHY